jgi:DNA-binding MarR family transcriptional regulator
VRGVSLARAFQVTKGTMSHTLSGLSGRGFIRVEPHETDRRSKLVFLTEAGRRFQREAIVSLGPLLAKLGQDFDLERLIAAVPVLREVREVLDANRDA